MKANYRINQNWALLAVAALSVQLSSAYAEGVFTNWNDLVTNGVETSAPNESYDSITSSSDGTKLAAVQDGGLVYTSTNGGVTWTQTSLTGAFRIASSWDGTKLVAIISNLSQAGGIYTSTNGGVTWTQTGAPYAFWRSIASSSDGTKLAAVVLLQGDGGIHTSTDGGVTWNRTWASRDGWTSIASSSDGTKLAAVGGGIWTAQATIQTNPPSLTNIIVTPANRVIAAGSNVIIKATGQFDDRSQTNLTSTNGQH